MTDVCTAEAEQQSNIRNISEIASLL